MVSSLQNRHSSLAILATLELQLSNPELPGRGILNGQVGIRSGTSLAAYFTQVTMARQADSPVILRAAKHLNAHRDRPCTVVMLRLPDEATLESRVRAGTASPAMLAQIARNVAAFHVTTQTEEHIAGFGSLEVIWENWEENFE